MGLLLASVFLTVSVQRSSVTLRASAASRLSHLSHLSPVCPPVCPAVQVLGVHLNKWTLDKRLGLMCLLLYSVFLCFSCLIEYNIFTFVNLPTCRDD